METFLRLFGSRLALVYHCFDRIVIFGYLPLLTRPEHIVHFFRDVQGVTPITKEVLRKRTDDYNRWVEAFARHHDIPIEWAEKGVRKEDYVRPALRQPFRKRAGWRRERRGETKGERGFERDERQEAIFERDECGRVWGPRREAGAGMSKGRDANRRQGCAG